MQVKKIIKSAELLAVHYTQISERLGDTIIPDETLTEHLANVCIRQELYTAAEELSLKNSHNYPNSTYAQTKCSNFVQKKVLNQIGKSNSVILYYSLYNENTLLLKAIFYFSCFKHQIM